jgi:hypothetical protein
MVKFVSTAECWMPATSDPQKKKPITWILEDFMSNLVSCRSLGDFCHLLSCWSLRIDCWVLEDFMSNLVSCWSSGDFYHLLPCWSLRIDCWVLEDFGNLVFLLVLRGFLPPCFFLVLKDWLLGPWGFQQHSFLPVLKVPVLKDYEVLMGFQQCWLLLQPIIFGVVVKMLSGTKNKVSCIYKGRTLGKRYGIKVWCCFLLGTC